MKTKIEYIEILESKSKKCVARIDLLTAKMEKSSGELKIQHISELKGLHTIQYQIKEQIKKIEEASGNKWKMNLVIASRVWDALSIGKVINSPKI